MRNKSWQEMVEEFMTACGQETPDISPRADLCVLYADLVDEEYAEVTEAEFRTPHELKELCDLIWVIIGYANAVGYDIDGAFRELYKENMGKVGKDGKVIRHQTTGKILKPEGFKPADMSQFVLVPR